MPITTRRNANLSDRIPPRRPLGLDRRTLLKGVAAGIAAPSIAAVAWPTLTAARARQADPATLTIGLDGSPSDIDPHSQYDYRSTSAVRGQYEGLIALKDDKTDEYVGLIAERWEANEDRSVWTFNLRPGVTFHDGSACDAEAVRLSYERLLTLGQGAFNVVGRFVTDPAQITAPDPQTVVFDLGRPQPLFEAAMASTYGPQVVNARLLREQEEDGDWGNGWLRVNPEETGTGTGPYRIVEFQPGERVILERYDGYWAGWDGTHFDRIVIRAVPEAETLRQLIEQGEVDIVDRFGITPEALPALEQNPDLVVERHASTEVEYFTMTVAGPLATPAARQAIAFAFPYDEVLSGVYLDYASQPVGPVPPTVRGYAEGTVAYATDLTRARELLAEAGVEEGTEIRLMQQTGSNPAISQLLQANLAEIGIELAIEQVDTTTFTATFYGDAPAEERPHLMGWSWWPDYNDAWNHLDPQVSCAAWGSKGSNGGFYCNDRVDALLAQARDAADTATYDTALAEAQRILSQEDPPAIYYAQPEWWTVLRQGIDGFVFNPIYLGTYDYHKLSRSA